MDRNFGQRHLAGSVADIDDFGNEVFADADALVLVLAKQGGLPCSEYKTRSALWVLSVMWTNASSLNTGQFGRFPKRRAFVFAHALEHRLKMLNFGVEQARHKRTFGTNRQRQR